MILFIKHIEIEGPETIGKYFQDHGYSLEIVDLQEGQSLPQDFSHLQAVISLGGPMNVYEEDKYPFLKAEDIFIKQIVHQQIPFLGICLGAQLLAKACGAKVVKSPQKEIGFFPIQLTKTGQTDPLFQGISRDLDVYQWHEDMFEIPKGEAARLVTSSGCPHQAFKAGPCAYGLQFHVEITDKSIREWSDHYFKDPAVLKQKKEKMLADYAQKKDNFHKLAEQIYANFLKIIQTKDANCISSN